jgi:hypothetical protein
MKVIKVLDYFIVFDEWKYKVDNYNLNGRSPYNTFILRERDYNYLDFKIASTLDISI